MTLVDELLASGRIADIAIGVMLTEALLLTAVFVRAFGRLPVGLLLNLTAGLMLLLALRAALTEGGASSIPALLVASLVAHAGDLSLRWRKE